MRIANTTPSKRSRFARRADSNNEHTTRPESAKDLVKQLLALWTNALNQRFVDPATRFPSRAWHGVVTLARDRTRLLVALAVVAALAAVLMPRLWGETALLRHQAQAGFHEVHRLLSRSGRSHDNEAVQR